MKLCQISSVFSHEILSILHNTREILHPNKIYSICLVVIVSPLEGEAVAPGDQANSGIHCETDGGGHQNLENPSHQRF